MVTDPDRQGEPVPPTDVNRDPFSPGQSDGRGRAGPHADPDPELPVDPDAMPPVEAGAAEAGEGAEAQPAEREVRGAQAEDGAAQQSPFGASRAPRREPIWDIVAVIAVGGALGGAARYGLNTAWHTATGHFPWSTFIENVSGCFLLGMLMVYLLDVWPPNRYLRPFLGVGVLGGFTTFSAYTSDTRAMLAHGEGPLAMVYFFGSILFGLLATWSGITLARTIAQDRVRDRYPSEDS